MKYFSILLLLSFKSYSQDTIPLSHLDKKYPSTFGETMHYYYQGKNYTGVAITGASPNYSSIQHFQAGLMHGPYISYYPNGLVKERTDWQGGMRAGKSEMFFENGQKMSQITFKDGAPCDTTTTWYENGQLKGWEVIKPLQFFVDNASFFYQNGNKQYEIRPEYYKKWYEDGTLQEEATMANNKKNGKVKFYNEKGKLTKIEWWEMGKLIKTKEKKK